MIEKEKYSQPLTAAVALCGNELFCQSSGNQTESLNEEKFDW